MTAEEKNNKPTKVKPSFYAYCFEGMKDTAKRYGYNLVLHGSMARDFDLIAIPWQDKLSDVDEMIQEFATAIGGHVMPQSYEEKHCFPHGRLSAVININRGGKWNNYDDKEYYIDISIIPSPKQNNATHLAELEKSNQELREGHYNDVTIAWIDGKESEGYGDNIYLDSINYYNKKFNNEK